MIVSTLMPISCSPSVCAIKLDPKQVCVYVGSSQLNTVVFNNSNVAPFHCCFIYKKKFWHIHSKVSRCIWVNEHYVDINTSYTLFPGDTIVLANEIIYEYQIDLDNRENSPMPLDELEPIVPDSDEVDKKEEKWVLNELVCTICNKLFIHAITLPCQHTFCQHCIEGWRDIRQFCPVCRTAFTYHLSTDMYDDLIDASADRKMLMSKRHRTPSCSSNSQPDSIYTTSSDSSNENAAAQPAAGTE